MKTILTILLSALSLTIVYSQTIRGKIVDKDSKYQLIGANVILVGSDPINGTVTDVNGEFKLTNIPVGRNTLKITYIGYKEIVMPNIIVNTGKETVLQFEMEEQVFESEEVVITSVKDKAQVNNEMAVISARSFDIEETSRYAGSLNDPARMATNFAGVSGMNDSRNDIVIRGNSPLGLLWRLEGVDIPNPNHFANAGSTGGPISILNNNLLDRSDFMTGAFPSNYGNGLSGVFDLQMRSGNNEKREYMGQFGFNGAEFGAEGPFSKKSRASYLCNYRYADLSVFQKMGINLGTGDAVPVYQDLSFKINIPTKGKSKFTVWGIGGASIINVEAKDTTKESKSDNNYTAEYFQTKYGTQMGVAGASHTYYFNEKTFGKLNIAVSGNNIGIKQDSVSFADRSKHPYFGSGYLQNKVTVNYQLVKKFNSKNTLQSGFFVERYGFNYADSVLNGAYFRKIIDYKGSLFLMQAYSQLQHRFSDKLSWVGGIHYQQLTNNGTYAIEPRTGINWELNKRNSLSLGVGMHSQMQPAFLYFYQTRLADGSYIMSNEKLGFSRSNQIVLGYNNRVSENIRVKAETYYQSLYNVPVEMRSSSFSMLNAGSTFGIDRSDSLVNKGTGYNYGVELTAEKFFSKGYYFLLTGSLFESKYKGSDGVERNTAFNGNFVVNLLAGKEFALNKKSILAFDYKMTYAGGKREIPIDLAKSIQAGQTVFDMTQIYTKRMPSYFRTDIKVTFRLNGKKVTQEWIFSIQNFTNQQNVFQRVYVASERRRDTQYQLGFFPLIQYKILF